MRRLTLTGLMMLAMLSCIVGCDEGMIVPTTTEMSDIAPAAPSRNNAFFNLRVFYVVASDGEHLIEREDYIQDSLQEARRFFGRAMRGYGFGYRTFNFAEIECVKLRNRAKYYELNTDAKINAEMEDLGISEPYPNMFFIDLPIYTASGCANADYGRNARMYSCWDWKTTAHEVGHLLGLIHDNRNYDNIMSTARSPFRDDYILHKDASAWINHHSTVNFAAHAGLPSNFSNPQIELIQRSPVKIQFRYMVKFAPIPPHKAIGYVPIDEPGFADFKHAVFYRGDARRGNIVKYTDLDFKGIETEELNRGTVIHQTAVYEFNLGEIRIQQTNRIFEYDFDNGLNAMLIGELGNLMQVGYIDLYTNGRVSYEPLNTNDD